MKKPIKLSSRDAVIEAAFQLLNRDPTASLADIAVAAGVGRATLHRHFDGRDDLLRVMAAQASGELERAADLAARGARSNIDALRKITEAIVQLGDRQWFLAQEQHTAADEVAAGSSTQNNAFHKLFKAAAKEGLFSGDCPVEWALVAYDHLVYSAWLMVRDEHATPQQAANLAWSTFTNGIGSAQS